MVDAGEAAGELEVGDGGEVDGGGAAGRVEGDGAELGEVFAVVLGELQDEGDFAVADAEVGEAGAAEGGGDGAAGDP